MTMDRPDEQKNIHVNPDFFPGKNKAQSGARVHVNPAFFQKSRPVQSNSFAAVPSQTQGLHRAHTPYFPNTASLSRVVPSQARIAAPHVKTSNSFSHFQPNISMTTKNPQLYNYENSRTSRTQSHYPSVPLVKTASRAAGVLNPTAAKPPPVPNVARNNQKQNPGSVNIQKTFRPDQQYPHLYTKKLENTKRKMSRYSWTANKAPTTGSTKVICSAVPPKNVQHNITQPPSTSLTNVPIKSQPSQKEEKKVKSQAGIPPSKSSSILVNPKLLQSISGSDTPMLKMLATQTRPQEQPKLEQPAHHSTVTRNLQKTPKDASKKFKIISKTKLVRRRSSSISTDGNLRGLIKKSYPKSSVSAIYQSSPKFPVRARKYSTTSGLKKRYLVKSRTKLVRQLSGSSTPNKESSSGNTKYSLKTKTKLVRRRSSGGSQLETPNKAESVEGQVAKSSGSKSIAEKGMKFFVISKTKLVRRRSNSGLCRSNVRSSSIKPVKCWPSKSFGFPQVRNANNVYKIINNSVRLSLKQKAAKGIISKYKINRLKLDSSQGGRSAGNKSLLRSSSSVYRVNNSIRLHPKLRGTKGHISKYKINRLKLSSSQGIQMNRRKMPRYTAFRRKKSGICSDRIINIGGILYKSTKTSLRKQQAKTKQVESNKNKADSTCIVHLRGDKFQVGSGGKTLKRVLDSTNTNKAWPGLSRVHIGGLTYSRTENGQYELTKVHQARAVLSSAKHRSVLTLSQRRKRGSLQKRNEFCIFFNRFGRCTKKDQGDCPYIHDPKRVAICTRFLRGRCPVNNCPFSHVIDPDKMPVCSHFLKTTCTRDNCPYRHVRVNPKAPVCLEFLQGHCTLGEECKNQHILVCEEFNTTGVCPRGSTCPLSHHRGRSKRKRSISLEPVTEKSKKNRLTYTSRKRKISENQDILGGPVTKTKAGKREKMKVSLAPQKRYFHYSSPANSKKDADKSENAGADQKISDTELCIPKLPDVSTPSVSLSNESQESKEDQVTEQSPSSVISRIEETRKRILDKMEKMKQTASNLELSDAGVLEERIHTKRDTAMLREAAHIPASKPLDIGECESKKTEDDTKKTEDCNDMGRSAQRPPLPKRLPSYIPLTMDDED